MTVAAPESISCTTWQESNSSTGGTAKEKGSSLSHLLELFHPILGLFLHAIPWGPWCNRNQLTEIYFIYSSHCLQVYEISVQLLEFVP